MKFCQTNCLGATLAQTEGFVALVDVEAVRRRRGLTGVVGSNAFPTLSLATSVQIAENEIRMVK